MTWQHIALSWGFLVEAVRLAAVGRPDDLGRHGAGLGCIVAIDELRPIVETHTDARLVVVVSAVRGGAAGAVPGDEARVAVHVIGALALWGGGARAGSWGGRALAACTVLRQAGVGGRARRHARGAAAGLDALKARAQVASCLAVAGRHAR